MKRKEIRADFRRLWKRPDHLVAIGLLRRFPNGGNNLPRFWSRHRHNHRCLDIRLIKTRKHLVSVKGFKLRVEINALVFRIDKTVKTAAIARVTLFVLNLDFVGANVQQGLRQYHAMLREDWSVGFAIEFKLFNLRAILKIQKQI